MNEPYVIEVDGEITLHLVNHLTFINKDEVTISSLYGDFVDVTLNRIEMLKIASFFRDNYSNCSTLNLGNIIFETNPNWIIITKVDKQVALRPEMFIVILKYVDERDSKTMNESNVTQNIFNNIISASNNQENNKPSETLEKTITTSKTQTKTNKTIYDTVIDITEKTNLGGNDNGKQQ